MPLLLLKDAPRYECLLAAAERYPSLEPAAAEAFLNLLRTGDLVFEAESRFLAQHHITQGRFAVLMLLNRMCGHASTPAELAEEAGVARATMTGLVDTLVKDGLVSREIDAHDRRAVPVRLTEKGEQLLEGILPDYFTCVSTIMASLNDQERRQCTSLLQKLQQGLAQSSAAHEIETAAAN
jgi:DNA-binding MarR family transcriptional regulator